VLRDPDGYTYFKEEVGGLVVGGFEPEAKPWVAPEELPYPFEFQLLAEDWEHFSVLMDSAVQRLPVLAETGIRKFYNGPESFTPDNQFILGEAPELAGFFVAAGFNSVGIAFLAGAAAAGVRELAPAVIMPMLKPLPRVLGTSLRPGPPTRNHPSWVIPCCRPHRTLRDVSESLRKGRSWGRKHG